jgi:hypothetical protein
MTGGKVHDGRCSDHTFFWFDCGLRLTAPGRAVMQYAPLVDWGGQAMFRLSDLQRHASRTVYCSILFALEGKLHDPRSSVELQPSASIHIVLQDLIVSLRSGDRSAPHPKRRTTSSLVVLMECRRSQPDPPPLAPDHERTDGCPAKEKDDGEGAPSPGVANVGNHCGPEEPDDEGDASA